MQLKHWRSRWREGIQPRETPNKPPCSELRIGRNASHVACTACVKLPADQPAVGARSKLKFTALLHHVNEDCLTEAFFNLKKSAAVGVDGVTWHEYERNMEERIADLHGRIHRGGYRALPSRRAWILKQDGRQRPLGIAALEDKIVQQAVVWVLQSIYEQDFIGFSYGFRPGCKTHDALDALSVALTSKKVNWILDADIEGFFDAIDHSWLIKFLEHRIGDRRILRLIRKWLHAGVIEEGNWSETPQGSPQGSVISPLLSNVYLHYVKLHEGKTRLIEFGRFAIERRAKRGEGRPDTFDFLGFTHCCGKSPKNGWFDVHHHSIAKRMRAKLETIKEKLRKRMHKPLGEMASWLRSVVRG